MRQQKAITVGNHNAFFQGTVNCPDGKLRLRFLVLDGKLKDTECIATLKKYSEREVTNLFKGDPKNYLNKKFQVVVAKNTYNSLLTITNATIKSFETPQWYIEHSENWQGSKNGEKNSATKEKYLKEREEKDPKFFLTNQLRSLQNQGIKGEFDDAKCIKLFGIDHKGLKAHIESTFKPGMTWSNRGKVWHLDHIVPFAKFDLTKKDQILKVLHYTNLQALTVEENLKKYDS